MNKKSYEQNEIKNTRFPASLFFTLLGVLLLMSGIHMGLIVMAGTYQWSKAFQTATPMIYWALVALGLTLYTRKKIQKTYDEPMLKLAEATKKVAEGNFSIYIAPNHPADKLDYLDVMILNFDKMVEELGSIETLKTDFVSNVSHEMKTPIAVIKNSAQILQLQTLTDNQRQEYEKNIEQASDRLSNLITNILKLNRLEHQQITVVAESYDICRQICDCVIQHEDRWEEKEIEIELELEEEVLVKADESLMELVWNNLLTNAIKFTELGGKIIIRQTSDGSTVCVTVEDSGCGMSQESITHIFDKFYQGDSSHATEGNGLGLALVYRVIQLMDGEITVESELGRGSVFKVTLPKS